MKRSCPQAALDTTLCLTSLDLYVKRCAARSVIGLRKSDCWKQRSIGQSRVLKIVFPDRRYEISEKGIDYIVVEGMFLPGLRMLIPKRAQWNGGLHQGQRGIPIFTDESKLDRSAGAGVFYRELGLELHIRWNDDCSVFQEEIFAILKAIEDLKVAPHQILNLT